MSFRGSLSGEKEELSASFLLKTMEQRALFIWKSFEISKVSSGT